MYILITYCNVGEVRLFIAAEFVEEQFCGGLLSDYHIKELSGYSPPSADNGWIPDGKTSRDTKRKSCLTML